MHWNQKIAVIHYHRTAAFYLATVGGPHWIRQCRGRKTGEMSFKTRAGDTVRLRLNIVLDADKKQPAPVKTDRLQHLEVERGVFSSRIPFPTRGTVDLTVLWSTWSTTLFIATSC